MITEGNFRLTGIKQHDITPEIETIINNAEKYLVICGYGFTTIKNDKSILKKVIESPVVNKHCILPINLFKGGDANRSKAKSLIASGVSVSLESKNHSKWIMSEKEIYYGSANFTMDSLENKIEVASFRLFGNKDPLQFEFEQFIIQSMKRVKNHADRTKLHGYITENDRLVLESKNLILRYNPSIEKVKKTIESINDVRTHIYEVVENCYWYLEDKDFQQLTYVANYMQDIVKNIAYRGLNLLEATEESNSFMLNKRTYNYHCDKFTNTIVELEQVSTRNLGKVDTIPKFTNDNTELLRRSINSLGGDWH